MVFLSLLLTLFLYIHNDFIYLSIFIYIFADGEKYATIDKPTFILFMRKMNSKDTDVQLSLLFDSWDADKSNSVSFKELCVGLAHTLSKNPKDQLKVAFSAFDSDGSAELDPHEVVNFIITVFQTVPSTYLTYKQFGDMRTVAQQITNQVSIICILYK